MYIVLDTCDPVILLQEIQDDFSRPQCSPSQLSTTINNISPLSSPLRPMSPETQQLFNMLTEYEQINNIN